MDQEQLPKGLIEGRRTPRFDHANLPEPLAAAHRTTVWAELIVESGSVRYTNLDEAASDVHIDSPDSIVIPPGQNHQIEPSTDAVFFVQFYRPPGAPLVPTGPSPVDSRRLQGPWEHRHRDLDSPEEVMELVTRQYVDVVQDDLLSAYFNFGPDHIDWQAHIGQVTDYWCHVLLFAPGYEIDTIENHRPLHETLEFTPEAFDRWLTIFTDTVDAGWRGPNADFAKKRATGMAWAMAQRLLGHGAWRPPQHRDDDSATSSTTTANPIQTRP